MQKHHGLLHIPDPTHDESSLPAWYPASDVDAFMTAAGLTNWATQAERISELEKALRAYFQFSEELSRLIDDDKDVRALNLALAMAGHRPKYRADIDEARNALMER